MIWPAGPVRVLVATKPVDFRKGMDGLAALVKDQMRADPFSGVIWVFRAKRAQQPTFYIRSATRDDRVPLAPAVRAHIAGVAAPTRQGPEVHLYGRTPRPEPRVAELDVRRGLLCRHGARCAADQHRGA